MLKPADPDEAEEVELFKVTTQLCRQFMMMMSLMMMIIIDD